MNLLTLFWQKICEPLDGFLWHRDISHPVIRPLLRNEILAGGVCILAGAALYAVSPWLFWFGCGITCMAYLFWSWARFFLRISLADAAGSVLVSVILRFCGRLVFFALLLLGALAGLKAPVPAILAGMVGGSLLGLGTFAWRVFHDRVS